MVDLFSTRLENPNILDVRRAGVRTMFDRRGATMASPILYVEMLTVGRRRRYFLLRVVYALLLLIAAWFCYEMTYRRYQSSPLKDQAEFAFAYFGAFTWLQLIAVVLLTPAMLAGTVASEHERRTIDYLLTTPLNDWEIALGKFTARLGAVAYQLAVGWPILAIFMTLGGVGPTQLAASFGIALLTLVSVGSLSLAISARAKTSREAITRTYLVLIALLTIPPMATSICEMFRHANDFPLVASIAEFFFEPMQWLTAFNPFWFIMEAVAGAHIGLPIDFPIFAAGHLGITALLLFSAVVGVRRFYLRSAGAATKGHDPTPVVTAKKPASAALATLPPPKSVEAADSPAVETEDRQLETDVSEDDVALATEPSRTRRAPWGRTLGDNPMLWKELVGERTALKMGILGKIAAFLLYGFAIFWILTAFFYSFDDHYFSGRVTNSPMQVFGMIGVPMISYLALLLITSRAAGSLTSEKEQDTWLTLISTPLEPREIVRAKIFGAISSVRYWYYLIGITWILCVMLYPPYIVAVPFLALAHGLAAFVCASIGVRASLKAATSLKAMGGALAIVLFAAAIAPLIVSGIFQTIYLTPFSLPTLVWFVHGFFMYLFSEYGRPYGSEGDMFLGLCVAGVFSLGCYWGIAYFTYRSAIDRFDEFSGRVVPQLRRLPTTIPPPQGADGRGATAIRLRGPAAI
ncbi:MAG: ABC transporter permease subunit [Pirellulales bacterium]